MTRKNIIWGAIFVATVTFLTTGFSKTTAFAEVRSMPQTLSVSGNSVEPVYTSLILKENEITLNAGEIETIEGVAYPEKVFDKTIVWESADTSIATVVRDDAAFNKAYITAESVGKTVITAKNAQGTVITECKVTVGNPTALEKMKSVKASTVTLTQLKGAKGTIKVKYKAVKFATGYQIRYKKSGKWIDIDTTKKTYTISKLPKGTYKIKVRPYKKYEGEKYYGKFTKVRSIKVK